MRVAAAVLTWNTVENGRVDLLRGTCESLAAECDVYVVDNGSSDGTPDVVAGLVADGVAAGWVRSDWPVTTSMAGTAWCAKVLAGVDPDIRVHSDDDVLWRPGWRKSLHRWWKGAPEDVALTGCHLERDYSWNVDLGPAETFGGVTGRWRASTGAATWSYRREHFGVLFPDRQVPVQRQGVGDVPTCERLNHGGWRVFQLDLAEHMAEYESTWGNGSWLLAAPEPGEKQIGAWV